MRKWAISAVLAFGVAAAAPALGQQRIETLRTANALGSVLAAEQRCGLSFDQAAIERFIDKNVPADDLEFPSYLTTMTTSSQFSLDRMSESSLTAHCAQIRRAARSYGFIGN